MPATNEQLSKTLESLDQRHADLNRQLAAFLESKKGEIEDHGRYIVAQGDELKKIAAEMVEVQKGQNQLRNALAKLEAGKGDGAANPSARPPRAVDALCKSQEFAAWRENPKLVKSFNVPVGNLWADADASMRKASDFTEAGNPGLITPWFKPEIVQTAKPMPRLRALCEVITIPITTNSVNVDRETAEYSWIACTTAAAVATDTSVFLDNTTGLGTTAPYNTLSITTVSGTDVVTVSAIDDVTGEVTFAPALSANVDEGANVTANYYLCTTEGALKPKSLDEVQETAYPVCKLASFTKASVEVLEDDARVERFLNTRLLNRQARMEDKALMYGPGTSGQITGIFTDADVPRYDWSGSEAGATKIDHIINVIYEIIQQNYTPTAVLVHPEDHKGIVKTKGTDDHYVFLKDVSMGPATTFLGLAFLWSNQLEADLVTNDGGDFIVGDMVTGCAIYDRKSDSIQVGFANDDFTRNMRTVLAERRFAFAIEQPLALAKGTFDSQP